MSVINIQNEIYKRTLLSLCAVFLLIFIIMVYTHTLLISSHYLYHTDFFKFYQSARFYFSGQNIYDQVIYPLNAYEVTIWHSKFLLLNKDLNPPFFTILLLPTAWLSYSSALMSWFVFSVVTMIAGILLVLKLSPMLWHNKAQRLWALTGLVLYFPNYLNLYIGQLSSLLLLLTILSLHACRDNKHRIAGILLGFALSIKLFFGIFLILFVVRKQWRVLRYMIATCVICSVIALWFFGINTYRQYFFNLKHIYWYSGNWNGSLLGFLTRLFGGNHEGNYAVFNLPQLTQPVYLILSFLLLIGFVLILHSAQKAKATVNDSRRLHVSHAENMTNNPHDTAVNILNENIIIQATKLNYRDELDWQFSLVIVLMLLVSPLGWVYYFGLLIIPFITIIRLNENLAQFNRNLILLSLIILLSSIPAHYRFPMEITQPLMVFTWASYYFYALMLLLVCLLFIKRQLIASRFISLNNVYQQKFSSSMQLLIYLISVLPSFIAFVVAIIY